MTTSSPKFDLLESQLGAQWSNIHAAQTRSRAKQDELETALEGIVSDDTSVVISGSLARGEFTAGSDIDWTLLVDGSADPQHLKLTQQIRDIVHRVSAKSPGKEGTFGNMVFSHNLIHHIGGEDDTNSNTTRRVLLLLESEAIGRRDAYDRVVKNLLKRYLTEDGGFSRGGTRYHVPRFLLNDFARYWRTMAVDFAYKQRDRSGKGAIIRNLKLRMSRKLIYVSGLLACFSCHLGLNEGNTPATCQKPLGSPECIECLQKFLLQAPIEILAGTLIRFNLLDPARHIFDAYDEFLGMLSDPTIRQCLETLPLDPDSKHETFQRARELSHVFQDGLLKLFFSDNSDLSELTKEYGVF